MSTPRLGSWRTAHDSGKQSKTPRHQSQGPSAASRHLDALELLLPLQQLLLQLRHPHHVLILQVQELLCELQDSRRRFRAGSEHPGTQHPEKALQALGQRLPCITAMCPGSDILVKQPQAQGMPTFSNLKPPHAWFGSSVQVPGVQVRASFKELPGGSIWSQLIQSKAFTVLGWPNLYSTHVS